MSTKHRLAILDSKKCKPTKCALECKRYCPVNLQGKLCIEVTKKDKQSNISEILCTGCGICIKKCPFDAIKIINLPKEIPIKEAVHRYGENSFKLFRLPVPRTGNVLGLVGTNGVGKTTAIKILSGKGINVKRVRAKDKGKIKDIEDAPGQASSQIPNLGDWTDPPDIDEIIKHFRGSELQNYFQKLKEGKIKVAVKPQDVKLIPKQVKGKVSDVIDKLNQKNDEVKNYYLKGLELSDLLERDIKDLSGGELQRLAICTACLKDVNVYIFDEPSNFLDIKQRLNVAKMIRGMVSDDSYVIVVEHDLAVLDYMSDYICCLYGSPGMYGVVTHPSSVQTGINIFLDGYIPSENMRFRNEPLEFKISERFNDEKSKQIANYKYPDMVKTYDGFKLSIKAGDFNDSEIVVLLGQNGTGKTTFINMLAGKLKDDADNSLDQLSVSYKPQHVVVKSTGTVRNVLLTRIRDAFLDPVFNSDVMKPMKIAEILDDDVETLSGGQRQRLAIVICLGMPANLYLLDEPSADLDSEQRVETARVVKRFILHNKKTAFIVEHDFMMASYMADRVIVYTGTPSVECTANEPQDLQTGMNRFLELLGVTFRRDRNNFRPRINKIGSARDSEQKRNGNFFFLE